MKQVSVTLSTYTADVSGVCSALYELGGMVVIHDPSGCNSTYNTHDEPRWYDMDSLIFISGLSQMDAIMGNDDKFINDIVRAAKELKPRFIALVRTPIPLMTGTDFELSRAMTAYWANFAKRKNPNGEKLPTWKPYTETDRENMLFQEKPHCEQVEENPLQAFVLKYIMED